MSNNLQQEVADLVNELRKVSKNVKGDTSRILRRAVKPLVAALFIAAPHGKKVHKRYSTVKLSKKIRAGRGKGTVVATYAPGNLAASFGVLALKKQDYRVTVGAKLAKGNATGSFGPFGRSDGYYAHMIERGTKNMSERPFVGPTWARLKEPTKELTIYNLRKRIKRLKK